MIEAARTQILAELTTCLSHISAESVAQAGELIGEAPRVFVAGAGRSGLCMKAFGMRLMHVGKIVYVVGETTTPAITADDLLIAGSGSGQTPGLLVAAGEARRRNSKILLFTTDGASPLAKLADHCVVLPALSYRMTDAAGRAEITRQPLGSLFEQSLWLVCDCLILELMERLRVDAAQMAGRHANLE